MVIVDYEFLSLSELEEVPVTWDFEESCDEDYEALEELQEILFLAEFFEELGYSIA